MLPEVNRCFGGFGFALAAVGIEEVAPSRCYRNRQTGGVGLEWLVICGAAAYRRQPVGGN